jgi:hypothetical protein
VKYHHALENGCWFGGDTKSLAQASYQILHILMTTYPGHHVDVYGFKSEDKGGGKHSVFRIMHLDFEQRGSCWGMILKGNSFYSASHMQTEVISKFGEWLERAYLKRGASQEVEIKKVDGVPEKNQKKELDIASLIEAGRKEAQENPLALEIIKQQERNKPWRPTG